MATIDKHEVDLDPRGLGGLLPALRRLSASTVRDLLLVGLTVSSGAIDAISFLALGKIFTAFMTGNFVFLGLALTGTGDQSVLPVCASLLAFAAGVFLGARVLQAMPRRGTWPPYMSLILGAAAVAQAGFLVVWLGASGDPSSGVATVLIILSAFAM